MYTLVFSSSVFHTYGQNMWISPWVAKIVYSQVFPSSSLQMDPVRKIENLNNRK